MTQHVHPWFITLLLSSLLLLAGCSKPEQPSEEQALIQATAYFNAEIPDLFEAVSIEIINGYNDSDTHYIAEFKIVGIAKQKLNDHLNSITKSSRLSPLEKASALIKAGVLKVTMNDFEIGDTFEATKHYLFIKTDKGWLLKKELTDNKPLGDFNALIRQFYR